MRRNLNERRRNEQGNVLIFVTIALFALLAFAAWSTETGQAWTARGQLQAATDSAALAGAGELLDPNGGQQADPAAAIAAAQNFGVQNHAIGEPIDILAGDVETGSWDKENRVFTPLPGSTDPEQVRAVRVLGRRDDTANGPIPTMLGKILGVDSIAVATDATAYIGWAQLMPPGTALLPIAIDCCKISGATCNKDYCDYLTGNPTNPCVLPAGADHAGKPVSCFEFNKGGTQNACWTELDSVTSGISVDGLIDIIRNSNPVPAGKDPIYVDNGVKTPLFREILDRFLGQGSYSEPSGSDTDGNGKIDSWLVPLPIIECQNPGDGCGGGLVEEIVGIACFDLQWVEAGSVKRIYGEFVCPGDPRFDKSKCDVGFGPGGDVPTIDAQYPVLVE